MKRRRDHVAVPEWRDALAGACAGAVSKTTMAPVERIKLLLQLQKSVASSVGGETSLQVAKRVYNEEGLLAFWRGNLPNVIRTAGQAALNFALMDYYKKVAVSPLFEENIIQRKSTTTENIQRRRKLLTSFVSGGMAGGTATTFLYPIEFLRTRLAMDLGGNSKTRAYRGMLDVLVSTYQTDGIRGLYQGYGIALAGGIFFKLLYLGGYDAIKTEWQLYNFKNYNQDKLSWGERFIAAQTISLSAGTICYPIDSVRRRLMMQAGKPIEQRLYNGSIHCFRVVWKKEGIRGFYLGIAPNIVRSIGGALMLVVYDMFKIMM